MNDLPTTSELLCPAPRRPAAIHRQQQRRTAECRARTHAAQLCVRLQKAGHSGSQVARLMHLNPRTLNHWTQLSKRQQLQPVPRGRPCHESSREQRVETVRVIQKHGLHLGMPTLRSLLPNVRRCELLDLRNQCRAHHRANVRTVEHRLHWHQPGTVWAIDHAEPPNPVDGTHKAVIAVRDLASGFQLAWLPVADVSAQHAIAVVQQLIAEHGAPLVLKSDNGSAFKCAEFAQMLSEQQVIHLRSPPATPQYNGACEASIGAMRIRTRHFADRDDGRQKWTAAHLRKAVHQANDVHRRETDPYRSARQRWQARRKITVEARNQFSSLINDRRLALCRKSEADESVQHQQSVERKAIAQALVDLGILTLSRRRIHPPFKHARLAKIS